MRGAPHTCAVSRGVGPPAVTSRVASWRCTARFVGPAAPCSRLRFANPAAPMGRPTFPATEYCDARLPMAAQEAIGPQVARWPVLTSRYAPDRTSRVPPSRASFSCTLTTPAMASEPYCAAAPSRSSSIWRTAMAGTTEMSGPCEPSAMPFPSHVITALRCRRLPLTRNRKWSGARFRRFVGLTTVAASEIGCVLTLNEGASVRSTSAMSEFGCRLRALADSTSTGTADSVTERC